jgi:hypothetical protein
MQAPPADLRTELRARLFVGEHFVRRPHLRGAFQDAVRKFEPVFIRHGTPVFPEQRRVGNDPPATQLAQLVSRRRRIVESGDKSGIVPVLGRRRGGRDNRHALDLGVPQPGIVVAERQRLDTRGAQPRQRQFAQVCRAKQNHPVLKRNRDPIQLPGRAGFHPLRRLGQQLVQ